MNSIDILQTVSAFGVSAVFLTIIGLISKKGSGKLVGFIAGLPTTIVLGMFFLQLSLGSDALFKATTFFYLSYVSFIISSTVYLLVFRKNKKYANSIVLALLAWLMIGTVALNFYSETLYINLAIYLSAFFGVIVVINKLRTLEDENIKASRKTSAGNKELVIKAIFGSVAVSLVVILSKTLGERPAALVSGAPAMFVATTYILATTKPPAYTIIAVPNIIIAAGINIPIYVFLIRVFAVNYGLFLGSIIVAASFVVLSPFIYRFIVKPLSV